MNISDFLFLSVIGLSALMGAFRGMTRELFGLVSWIGAGFATYTFYPFLHTLTLQYVENPMLGDIIGVVSTLLIFFILLNIFSYFLSVLISFGFMGGLEWSFGFVFGVVRGCLFLVALEMTTNYFMDRPDYPQPVKESFLIPYIFEGSNFLFPILPHKIQTLFALKKQKYENEPQEEKSVDRLSILKPKTTNSLNDVVTYSKNTHQNMERYFKQ